MRERFRWSRHRRRSRATGCLLWIIGLIIVLIVLSVLFGGFQKGSRVGGMGMLAQFPASAAR
jgi:ABC-type lipoprotein release transport system permease subunit